MNPNLNEKNLLDLQETLGLFNLSARKFRAFLKKQQRYPFLIYYREHKLIVRELFEDYLKENPDIREALTNAKRKK